MALNLKLDSSVFKGSPRKSKEKSYVNIYSDLPEYSSKGHT